MSDSRWDPLFEDLEHQFASEKEQDQGAMAGESERARIAALGIRERLAPLVGAESVLLRDAGGEAHRLRLLAASSEWIAGEDEDRPGLTIVRSEAIDEIRIPEHLRAPSLAGAPMDPLLARMSFGFVLRALARRRAAVVLATVRGGRHSGTVSRAGADHVDLALHEQGASVLSSREEITLPLRTITWVRTADRGAIDTGF